MGLPAAPVHLFEGLYQMLPEECLVWCPPGALGFLPSTSMSIRELGCCLPHLRMGENWSAQGHSCPGAGPKGCPGCRVLAKDIVPLAPAGDAHFPILHAVLSGEFSATVGRGGDKA
ncbi:hypothetical protein H1C71_029347 [Ictidomys tridecemlineatus]|nr:hypothetical protein H1C71_029347 [Ictidomys tridecemlineatus]